MVSPAISNDGRYIAFQSTADNLVANDTNTVSDIFVHDRLNNTTERVSVSSTGIESNRDSFVPSISQDGRFVAFESPATNLVTGSSGSQIFVHDRQAGTTEIVSVVTTTVTPGNGTSHNPSISADGRYVVFESLSTDIVPDDTNGHSDIFVHDRQTGTTQRISVSSIGEEGDGGSFCYHQNSISGDGQYIVFHSAATNFAAGDLNASFDIFVHDQATSETRMISTTTFGVQGDADSLWPSISADGQVKAFGSEASNLMSNDTNTFWDVFIVHPFNN